MEQFSLEKYFENPSRKVVTRDGREVEILKVDAKRKHPIIGVYQFSDTEDMESSWRIDGRKTENGESSFDLFFADKEELTEFDYAVLSIISDHNSHTDSIEAFAKRSSKKLLDLARKEILKDLPKYKKAQKDEVLDWVVKFDKNDNIILSDVVYKGEYFITLQSLKILPKESEQ